MVPPDFVILSQQYLGYARCPYKSVDSEIVWVDPYLPLSERIVIFKEEVEHV